ncbi:N-terminal EF-hand calcium-binding protein 1-like isoform X2 [Physella acuta]|uniref:N-terminal EF-hand calcium-binding protein 1-like isoform X2 n=1 Tax=Physella acuta TaxID=109671 RepID=UPI0027DD1FBE|nr:N-terminal EF-hand calcium-binding protein 1-like isoform X2 [Physella acuta]
MAADQITGISCPVIPDKGMAIFFDVFRRADKNDDGSISWEEFVCYFADGVMGKEELCSLFEQIDSHNTNNIDIGELCTYFTQHLGDFKEIFGLLEEMNRKMTNVLYGMSKTYKDAGRLEKFAKRFFLKELLNQITALQHPLEAALDALDTQAREERSDIQPLEASDIKKPHTSFIPGRVARRNKHQASPMNSGEGGSVMHQQVERLARLIDRLEHKINFEGFRDEEVVPGEDNTILMIQKEFVVQETKLEDFNAHLRAYVDTTLGFRGCLNVSIREFQATHSYNIYEIWTCEESYIKNCNSDSTKTLVSATAEMLEKPETVNSLKIPSSWWKRSD